MRKQAPVGTNEPRGFNRDCTLCAVTFKDYREDHGKTNQQGHPSDLAVPKELLNLNVRALVARAKPQPWRNMRR